MALARFFDKSALAASHVLQGYDHQLFSDSLASSHVALFFDDAAEKSHEGRWTLGLSVNLLARFYPRIAIVSHGSSSFVGELSALARVINPLIEVENILHDSSLCLVVGESVPSKSAFSIYVGSNGWVAKISSLAPVGSANTPIPFGANAAACLGVANLFRANFRSQLEDGRSDENWQMSLLDFDPAARTPSNPQIVEADFAETHLVGLGAIGNGCVATLAQMRNLRGRLHLVDYQEIELSNLQRYVLTDDSSVGKSKVLLAKDRLASTGLDVFAHSQRWGEYLRERNNWNLPRVAVGVDTPGDRQAIQAALPEWIVNAWTQVGDLGISRHGFLGNQACLACLYLPSGPLKNEDELISEAIGLPGEKLIVRQMLMTNEPMVRSHLNKIAEANKVDVNQLLEFEGLPLRQFYARAACGGMLLRLGATSTTQRQIEVPMAFQSTLAGIFLAAELVAKAAGLKNSPPPVTTKLDLLRPLGTFLSMPAPKHPSGSCICQDDAYIQAL